MFDQLPETYPSKNTKRPRAFATAAGIQALLIALVVVIQMAMPERLGQFQLLTTLYMAAPPPPPAPPLGPPPARQHVANKPSQKVNTPAKVNIPEEARPAAIEKPELTMPTAIPKEIPRVSEPGAGAGGVVGSVPGGVAGGVPGGAVGGSAGGIFAGVLGGAGDAPAPPPPPPQGPVRVGGDVRAPKLLNIVQPRYPAEAKRARIEGTVVIEATVNEDGSVSRAKVISGHPLLVNAAIDAVQQWKYEPTSLNGKPVAVILTAKVTFALSR
jgi:periplasmic protein TonB